MCVFSFINSRNFCSFFDDSCINLFCGNIFNECALISQALADGDIPASKIFWFVVTEIFSNVVVIIFDPFRMRSSSVCTPPPPEEETGFFPIDCWRINVSTHPVAQALLLPGRFCYASSFSYFPNCRLSPYCFSFYSSSTLFTCSSSPLKRETGVYLSIDRVAKAAQLIIYGPLHTHLTPI